MPFYEYRCENGHLFEVMQKITQDPVTACEECGAPVQRVFHPIAVHFKGSGFYITDYRPDSYKKAASADSGSSGEKSGGEKSGGEKKDSGSKSEPKGSSSSKSD